MVSVLAGIHANPYVVDAIIGFSIVYKAFEFNTQAEFRRLFGYQPNTKIAVMIFLFFHGFGSLTKLRL